MDKVIIMTDGGIQKHDCKSAFVDWENRVIWIRKTETSMFWYNMDNITSCSILHVDQDKKSKEEN